MPLDEIRALDLGAERIWPPAAVRLEGGWHCRLDRGVTRRANSVLPLDWAGAAPGTAVDSVVALYQEAGLQPCFQVTEAAQPSGLDGFLAKRGFRREGASLVQRRPANGSLWRRKRAEPEPGQATLSHAFEEPWLACLFRGQGATTANAREAILRRIEKPIGFASLSRDGRVLAVGLGVLDDTVGWINCMHTDPAARRRGFAGAILQSVMAWLRQAGAQSFCLQVEADNAAARALYEAAGFEPLYRYHYRVLR